MSEEVPPASSDRALQADEGPLASQPRPAVGALGPRRLVAPLREADATASARRRVLEARSVSEVEADPGEAATSEAVSRASAPGSSRARELDVGLPRPLMPAAEPYGPATPRPPRALEGRSAAVHSRRLGTAPPAIDRAAAALSLSPRMTAVFGGLFGLATVTTVIALLIQSTAPRDDRALVASASSASTEPSASGDPAEAVAEQGPKKRQRKRIPGPWRIADAAKDDATRVIEGKFDRRSFIVALGEAGIPKDQTYRVLKAFEGQRKLDRLGKNDRFVALVDRASKRLVAFELIVSALEIWQVREQDGVLSGGKLDLAVGTEEVAGAFYVSKDLERSIAWGGFEPGLLDVIDDALAGRMSREGFEEGGIVRVIVNETTALGDFAAYDKVVALEYRPPDPAANPVRAYSFQGRSARGYFDDRGRQPDGGGWVSPVPGSPITSRFNPKRLHPVLKTVMPHNGTDYGAPTGTPVYAAFRGKVVSVGPAGACGNMVQVAHPGGIETVYCHLSRFAKGIKAGDKVGTKQLVGYVGSTGRSTGPHLHFGAKKDGKWIDSETLKVDGFRVLPVDERAAFQAHKAELDARLDAIPLPEPPPAPAPKKGDDEKLAAKATKGGDQAGAAAESPVADEPSGDEPSSDAASAKAPKSAKPAVEAPVDDDEGEDIIGPDLRK